MAGEKPGHGHLPIAVKNVWVRKWNLKILLEGQGAWQVSSWNERARHRIATSAPLTTMPKSGF